MQIDATGRHPGTQHIVQFFTTDHLPPRLAHVVDVYAVAVQHLLDDLEDGPELTVALRHLLDSKDAAVRQRVVDLKKAGTPAPKNTPEPELRG